MRHLTGRARSREEVLEEWVPVLTREDGPGGVLGYWAGFSGGDFVGWWALNPDPDDARQAELGYRLRRDAGARDWPAKAPSPRSATASRRSGWSGSGPRPWRSTPAPSR